MTKTLSLFQGFGLELEYMIVDRDSLDVLPITDKVMYEVCGSYENEVERGELSWSNELALHVIELKSTEPVKLLKGSSHLFQDSVRQLNDLLKKFNAQLMPTAMHPWMDPYRELQLWSHGQNSIYESFNRIFDCRGHGWANLQSSHLNLPFSNDAEFAKLHAAIRFILPILPALAASSPIMEKKMTGIADNRLEVYRNNSASIPSIAGKIIPEACLTQKEYENTILKKIYNDIAPQDPEKILQYEWLNARGAIARFERNTIEIRVLDVQECPDADLAIINIIVAVVKYLTEEKNYSVDHLNSFNLDALHELFLICVHEGDRALINDTEYLKVFEYEGKAPVTVWNLWKHLINKFVSFSDLDSSVQTALEFIVKHGPLSRRISNAWSENPTLDHLKVIYRHLAHCLEVGKMFLH